MDLVELTASRSAWSPNTSRIAAVSIRSFSGVEVPWAFTASTSEGGSPASSSAARITRTAPPPSSAGAVMWKASPLIP